jgi:hypothetical protein
MMGHACSINSFMLSTTESTLEIEFSKECTPFSFYNTLLAEVNARKEFGSFLSKAAQYHFVI